METDSFAQSKCPEWSQLIQTVDYGVDQLGVASKTPEAAQAVLEVVECIGSNEEVDTARYHGLRLVMEGMEEYLQVDHQRRAVIDIIAENLVSKVSKRVGPTSNQILVGDITRFSDAFLPSVIHGYETLRPSEQLLADALHIESYNREDPLLRSFMGVRPKPVDRSGNVSSVLKGNGTIQDIAFNASAGTATLYKIALQKIFTHRLELGTLERPQEMQEADKVSSLPIADITRKSYCNDAAG
jgi:hypothetical protein